MPDIRQVNPGGLRLPPEREGGADNFKLTTQYYEYGESTEEMPPILVIEGANGELQIYDGVTRATRAYMTNPYRDVYVEVTGVFPEWNFNFCSTIGESVGF